MCSTQFEKQVINGRPGPGGSELFQVSLFDFKTPVGHCCRSSGDSQWSYGPWGRCCFFLLATFWTLSVVRRQSETPCSEENNRNCAFSITKLELVGGLVAILYFPIYWESHHPNQLTFIFFRGVENTNLLFIQGVSVIGRSLDHLCPCWNDGMMEGEKKFQCNLISPREFSWVNHLSNHSMGELQWLGRGNEN